MQEIHTHKQFDEALRCLGSVRAVLLAVLHTFAQGENQISYYQRRMKQIDDFQSNACRQAFLYVPLQ